MLELQSDLVRRMALDKASVDVRATGASLGDYESLVSQAHVMNNRYAARKKRRFPWGTVIVALCCFSFLFAGEYAPKNRGDDGDIPTDSITLKGKTLTQDIPVAIFRTFDL